MRMLSCLAESVDRFHSSHSATCYLGLLHFGGTLAPAGSVLFTVSFWNV